MNDIIYILVVVLWVAISFYSSWKKSQKRKENSFPKPAAPTTDFEDVLRRFLNIEEPKPVPQAPQFPQKEIKQIPSYYESLEKIESENESLETIFNEIDTKETFRIKQKEPTHTENDYHAIAEGFDVRKAVIWSEILNRKYQ